MNESGLSFDKIHACGNDFILLNRESLPADQIIAICDRHHGLGADGIMFFRGLGSSGVLLDHCDPDGSHSFCLNGLRSALACLAARDLIPQQGRVSSEGMDLGYQITATVQIKLPLRDWRPLTLELNGIAVEGYFSQVGNPQFVVLDSLEIEKFRQIAASLRHHAHFPEGANVNLVFTSENHWRIITYERGVEDFTLACGSGMYASALVLFGLGHQGSLVFKPEGQDTVTVSKEQDGILFLGPTRHVASGVWLC